jgi:hypothetical protein
MIMSSHKGKPEMVRGPVRLPLVPPGSPRRVTVKPLGIAPLGRPVLVGLSVPDARHHVHVLGPTGTGKSTLLVNWVCAEARAGRGVAVFDPKGDLVRDLMHRLPESAGRRLVLIDPDEQLAPVALNLLDLGADPEAVADQVAGVMGRVWAQYWGPRTDDLARHAVLTLAHLTGATLSDLPVLIADPGYRHRVLTRLSRTADAADMTALAGFWAWWDGLSPGQASVQAGPLLSKLRAVLSRRFAAALFGTAASTFTLPDILDGGILLVRLPKGVLGEDTVRLAGSLLLAALLQAAAARASQPEDQRPDATVVVDECHNFLHLPIGLEDALAEARGLRVSLVLAHQNLSQLAAHTASAIDANARNKVFFALAPADARHLAHHVEPYFAAEDLTRRDAYGIVARLVINGRDSEPFSLHTRPAPPAWPGRAQALRHAARAHGLPAADRQALAEARRLGPAARRLPAGPNIHDNGEPDSGQTHDRHPEPAKMPAPPAPLPPPRSPGQAPPSHRGA